MCSSRPERARGRIALAWAAVLHLAGAAGAAPAVAPAAGGAPFLAAAESAAEVVVGRVRAPARLDLHGWRAEVVVERALRGVREPGAVVAIGWEELSTKRPPRFADGARVALALEPLPPGSLWSGRFPRRDAVAVAARGEAFVREPTDAALEPLAVWLALPASEREGPRGVAALAALAARGEEPLARAALARLDRVGGLAERVAGPAAESLAALLADRGRPLALRREAFGLTGRRGLRALEPALEELASTPSEVQGPALDALARLRGGLAPERTADLLRADDPAVRAAAVRRGEVAPAALTSLLSRDPDADVRAAAAEALAERTDPAAAEPLVRALGDDASPVRAAAMRALAGLGPEAALPALRREIWDELAREPGRSSSAVLTLALLGSEGVAELQRIAHEHPSERVRRVAELALGRLPEDH